MLNSNLILAYKWETVKTAAETTKKIIIIRKLAEPHLLIKSLRKPVRK